MGSVVRLPPCWELIWNLFTSFTSSFMILELILIKKSLIPSASLLHCKDQLLQDLPLCGPWIRFLDSLYPLNSVGPIQLPLMLQKADFLNGLALGAWISELGILRWGKCFILHTPSCRLLLSPGPSFLAKNVGPLKRKALILIRELSISNKALCPVQALRVYLDVVVNIPDNPLFPTP